MSKDQSDDDRAQRFLWEAEDGVTPGRQDSEPTSPVPPPRPDSTPRPDSGAYGNPMRSRRGRTSVTERWLIPASAVVLVIFIITVLIFLSRGERLDTLTSEVAALKEQSEAQPDAAGIRAEMDQLDARVEGVTTRMNAVNDIRSQMQALQRQVTEQSNAIKALTGRVDELEKALKTGEQSSAGSGAGDAPSQAAPASQPAGGGNWAINLIAVTDRASAEQFQSRLNSMGVESRIETIERDGKSLQRVLVPGYETYDAAQSAALGLKSKLDLSDDPWITRE